MNSNKQLYMYILVNSDLNMSKGKIASQVGHVVGEITEKIIRKSYESNKIIPDCYSRFVKWKNSGNAKIILKATQEQIITMIDEPESIYIIDSGKTEIKSNSLTCIGFYPNTNLKEKFKNFKLL